MNQVHFRGKDCFGKGEHGDKIMSPFDLHVSSGASLLAFKIRSVGGS